MIESTSEFIPIRGLRYHVRRWGEPGKPMLFLAHGMLDASETFSLMVQPLLPQFQVLCPDWRGLGLSEWPQDGYFFPDYVADLEAVIDHYAPAQAIALAGHSMGAQAASLYAGLRPERVSKFICLDGLFLPDMAATLATKRFRKWLDELRELPAAQHYASFDELAARVRKRHPQLPAERALFVARCWGRLHDDNRVHLLADPKHRLSGPGLYRAAESEEIWKQITAQTLFIDGADSFFVKIIPQEEKLRRRECFKQHQELVIAGAGHMLHFDAPEETGRAIAAFLSA